MLEYIKQIINNKHFKSLFHVITLCAVQWRGHFNRIFEKCEFYHFLRSNVYSWSAISCYVHQSLKIARHGYLLSSSEFLHSPSSLSAPGGAYKVHSSQWDNGKSQVLYLLSAIANTHNIVVSIHCLKHTDTSICMRYCSSSPYELELLIRIWSEPRRQQRSPPKELCCTERGNQIQWIPPTATLRTLI